MTIHILPGLYLEDDEIQMHAVRAQGAGGQNVNKVSSAIHLRFDIKSSSLPDSLKQRLLHRQDQRISKDGVLVIKAQQFRTQEQNREDALARLQNILREAQTIRKARKPTRPTRGSQLRRLGSKQKRGKTKALRGRVRSPD